MLWSDLAWTQLLGCAAHQFAVVGLDMLREWEERLMFLRIVVRFGWWVEGERLVVLGVGSV